MLELLCQWDRLIERGGVLYRQILHPDDAELVSQLLLPASLKDEVLTEVHQRHCHQSVDKVLELLRQQWYWPGITSAVVSSM